MNTEDRLSPNSNNKVTVSIYIGFITAFLFCCNAVIAQDKINAILSHVIKQPAYKKTPTATESTESIPSLFGKPGIRVPEVRVDLSEVQVTAIDLVFTDFPAGNDLIALNTNRLHKLFAAYPDLESDSSIEWRVIRQMDGAEKVAAQLMFHGFVIYFRPLQNEHTIATDLEELKKILGADKLPVKPKNGFVTPDTSTIRIKYEIEEYTEVLKLPIADALRYVGIPAQEKDAYIGYDSLYVYVKPSVDSAAAKRYFNPPPDSTVLKVLDRMHWNRMLVVTDVTASMFPYSGQLLIWLKLHEAERRINRFVFFNDGDNKADEMKTIGNTGGVYNTNSSVFEVVEQLLYKTMSNGNGGNIPENNIEALLKGIASCNDCASVIMIADNSSAVSDMALLKQVQLPVHIILCGVHDALNSDYLEIARSTGGSVHTADEDLEQLLQVKEGEQIMLHGRQYKITNGKFVAE
ncbi:hypothetical protein [Ferruginibacter sp.]